jgi:hydrogenase maturation factor
MSCADGHCITCSDEGVEMRVVRIDEPRAMALCEDAGGTRSSVEIALVEAREGDTLLVHAGTALLKLRRGRVT